MIFIMYFQTVSIKMQTPVFKETSKTTALAANIGGRFQGDYCQMCTYLWDSFSVVLFHITEVPKI